MHRTWRLISIVLLSIAVLARADSAELTAVERGLTATDIKAAVLAEEGNKYHSNVAQKNFQGNVLGYVTPWNGHGYDVAVRWRAKFTHISPVWYQLRGAESTTIDGDVLLTGGHDVDQDWIGRVRTPGVAQDQQQQQQDFDCQDRRNDDATGDSSSSSSSSIGGDDSSNSSRTCAAQYLSDTKLPLIVPRFIAELSADDLTAVLQKPGKAIAAMMDEVVKQKFDGLVFEGWLQWAAMGGFRDKHFTTLALAFIKKLAANLKDKDKVLLLAVPPVIASHPSRPAAQTELLQQLSSHVAGFSVMTYDYATGDAAPNSPIHWQEENVRELIQQDSSGEGSNGMSATVQPSQVFMGLNFYGYDFTKPETAKKNSRPTNIKAVMGDEFLRMLKRHKPKLVWQEQHAEHRVKYKEGGIKHTVYYPTPASLAARIKLAEQLGVSLSIWELGQGMDAFYDLL